MSKDRIRRAVERFSEREQPTKKKPKKYNSQPEEKVVRELLQYYSDNNFFINRYESKAKRIQLKSGASLWRTAGVEIGTPDLLGCCPNGFIHANEVKAKGRRSTLREEQREFLTQVIIHGGFGVCCDSVEYLRKVYAYWIGLRNLRERKQFLLDQLPKRRTSRDSKGDESF